ncbi:hypothetical protein AB0B66_34365 [Catellatospora sp. NPDC049111]|uniref:hypothetical protein n=1 Tax=Catellatospora sp. NPDC049111 TaxID=3155271 RepID=UPI0033E53467
MTQEFAAVMAQVIPVVALALVVHARGEVARAQSGVDDVLAHNDMSATHAELEQRRVATLAIQHSLILLALAASEILCLLAVQQIWNPGWGVWLVEVGPLGGRDQIVFIWSNSFSQLASAEIFSATSEEVDCLQDRSLSALV